MKCVEKLCLLLLVLAVPINSQAQPVDVSLPDSATGSPGTSINLPILIGDITGRNVFSYDAAVAFDSSILQATGASETGTLSEPFGDPTVTIVEGLIAVSASGAAPLSGTGPLVNLQFDVVGSPGQSTQLQFIVFRFNGGAPVANTNDGMFTVTLSQEPEIVVSPEELNFGEVPIDSTAARLVTITNTGSADLDITDIVLTGDDPDQFTFEAPSTPFLVSPQDSESINLQFMSLSPGLKNAIVEISSNDPNRPSVTVALSGTGIMVGEPDIALAQSEIVFGAVTINTTNHQPLAILNKGNGDLIVESLDFSGADASEFIAKIPALPFAVAPGDSQLVTVGFRPQSAGMKAADVQILSNDPDEQTLMVPVSGLGINPPEVTVSFRSPENGATLCGDRTEVTATIQISGGLSPIELSCEIDGIDAAVTPDSMFSATVPLLADSNFVVAECRVIDALENEASGSDTLMLLRAQPPICDVEIISPVDSSTVASDSVEVEAVHAVLQGSPPFVTICEINGVMAAQIDSSFKARVPLSSVDNLIVVTCVTTDSCGNRTTCSDSVRIFRSTPICNIEIVRPVNDALVCESLFEVEAVLQIMNAVLPVNAACDINGIEAQVSDSLFSAAVPLNRGDNKIIATCSITDSNSQTTICVDSIGVFLDTFKPNCRFEMENGDVVGTFFDRHSGIQRIDPVEIRNGILTVAAFSPGDKNVNFRITPIEQNKKISFSIDITDVCGNRFNCDPIFLTLSPATAPGELSFQFPSRERYLQIENFGLSYITIELNGGKFQLSTEPEPAAPFTTYVMPKFGKLTLDLSPQLDSKENRINITIEGTEHAYAELFLSDQAETVDHIVEIKKTPTRFALAQNYPNPFNATTTIHFDIPPSTSEQIRIRLLVYNLKGELVRTLLDQERSPGTYTQVWNGTDRHGEPVSSGIYIYRIVAGDFIQSRRMLLLK